LTDTRIEFFLELMRVQILLRRNKRVVTCSNEIYFRFLETEDENFDYAPTLIPPQGRWKISGLGLPEPILKQVYWQNAASLLGLPSDPGDAKA
jgi:hypothetical protein